MGPRIWGIGEQKAHMMLRHPQFSFYRADGGGCWRGELRPSNLSKIYTVEITYKPPLKPKISVLTPKLVIPEKGRLPHVYGDTEPCLYYPDEWTPENRISDLIPWLSEWLLHYEGWQATNVWSGGGIHLSG